MGAILGQMVMTSLSVVLPGLYFLLMVEPHPEKAYRYKFLMKSDALERVNNAITVGIVGYSLFIFTIPILDWFFSTTFQVGLREAVISAGFFVQLAMLVMLALINMMMAYLGLQK
jgi:hypothetical protein